MDTNNGGARRQSVAPLRRQRPAITSLAQAGHSPSARIREIGRYAGWRSLTLAYGVALDYWKYATSDGDIGLAHRWKQLCGELQAAYRQRPGGGP